MDEITLLQTKIESLKKEIEDNPDYSQNIKDSILDDIDYYQNHLNHLNDTLWRPVLHTLGKVHKQLIIRY